MRVQELLCVLRDVRRHLGEDVELADLARRSGWSRFHLHRAFRRIAGETPKQFTQRLRLECAAAKLLGSEQTVAEIALAAGFASHEVFTRAFRRHFGCVPMQYRALRHDSRTARAKHMTLTAQISPCIRLFHLPVQHSSRKLSMPTLSIERTQRPAQPILLIRRRIARNELPNMLADCYGKLFAHGHAAGLAIAGQPLARYVSMGPGLWTVEAAMPLASPASGSGEMEAGSLPAGPVALGIHAGPYEELPETNAAIERWIEAKGYRVAGPPWESYVTDPAQYPNPADWRTEVYWPLAQ